MIVNKGHCQKGTWSSSRRAITPEMYFGILPKVNQAAHTSYSITVFILFDFPVQNC